MVNVYVIIKTMSYNLKTPFSNKIISIPVKDKKDTIIAAIESSCDEMAFAIVKNGREVLSNVVASQINTHKKYGGVVPEVAAREHLNSIAMVIEEGFNQSGLKGTDITAFASTIGPGLVGSLIVGVNAAKTLSIVYDKPFIGVNHLKAHVCANYIDTDLKPPFIALLISGGHTQILKVDDYNNQTILGGTIDDAIGEVYDKVARLMDIEYPGGPNLDKIAAFGNKERFQFTKARVNEFDFSFSGTKTALLHLIQKLKQEYGENYPKNDVAASFQENVTSILFEKTINAAKKYNINQIVLAGGVAANSEIRKKFFELKNYKVFAPKMKYCTDNAAMVASCAYFLNDNMNNLDIEVFSRI